MLIFTACVFWVSFGSFGVFADGPPSSCCLKLGHSRPPLDKVLNYKIQTKELCPITAVVIQTVSGKILCSDPNSAWTKRAMRKVDEAKMKFRKQDPVHAEGASSERSRGRADPKTATELPLNNNHKWVSYKGPKEKRSDCKREEQEV
uniref:Chemokine interleukin-8-like domain-containing protein n=1 Tax=Cyprinus carpio TaxID=7962 RepID=A0A8C2IRR9_CYPCA